MAPVVLGRGVKPRMDGKVGVATSWKALNAMLRSVARCTSPLPEPQTTTVQISRPHPGPPDPNLEGKPASESVTLVTMYPVTSRSGMT